MRTRRKALAFTLMVVAAGGAAKLQLDPAPVRLSMQPERVRTCETPVATVVEWDASALRIDGVELFVANLGRSPKLWTRGGARGIAETGAWAHEGYTVTLKTLDGRVLARRTLTAEPCR
jgi:hypothetical protein